tara:strand:- start:24631 stop:25011 length:381 start_codon:yes stop_codon:yes gene_type:complete
METNREELMSVLQKMENGKLKNPILCDENNDRDDKFDLLAMNILLPSIYAVQEINELLKKYEKQIIVISLPITKYKNQIHHTEIELTKLEIEKEIESGNKIMIYSTVSEINYLDEIKYRVKVLNSK